jgi:hypothetical protein
MFAEALMMLAPWKLWTVPWPTRRQSSHSWNGRTCCNFGKGSLEASYPPWSMSLIHPHHAWSYQPHRRRLYLLQMLCWSESCTDHGHLELIHMPSHIYMWMGNYEKALG